MPEVSKPTRDASDGRRSLSGLEQVAVILGIVWPPVSIWSYVLASSKQGGSGSSGADAGTSGSSGADAGTELTTPTCDFNSGSSSPLGLLDWIPSEKSIAFLLVLSLVLYLIALIGGARRHHWQLLGFGLVPGHLAMTLLWLAFSSKETYPDLVRHLALVALAIAALISLIYFSLRGRLLSKSFLFSLLLIAVPLGWETTPALIFLILTARFGHLVYVQNWPILVSMGFQNTGRTGVLALLLWSPILLFAIPGEWFSRYSHQALVRSIYLYTFIGDQQPVLDDPTTIEKDESEPGTKLTTIRSLELARARMQAVKVGTIPLTGLTAAELEDFTANSPGGDEPLQNWALFRAGQLNDELETRWSTRAKYAEDKVAGDSLQQDTLTTTDCLFAQADAEVDAHVTDLRSDIAWIKESGPRRARDIYLDVVPDGPTVIPYPPVCPWYDFVACPVKRTALNMIRSKYDEVRSDIGKKVQQKVEQSIRDPSQNANAALTQIEEDLKESLRETHTAIREILITSQTTMAISRVMVGLVFLYLCVRSYLYVFGRIALARGVGGAFATLNDTSAPVPKGSVRKAGARYSLSGALRSDFYVSRKFEPNGRPPRFSIPQASTGVLGRLRHGCWTMNHVQMDAGRGAVYFSTVQGAEFIEWELEKNEVVVFDYKYFVAMSEDVELKTLVSFRLSTLLLGRVTFPAARGPGKLVLKCNGRPLVGNDQGSAASISPSRLLAWNIGTRFEVESELRPVDIFLSSLSIKRQPSDLIVIDADTPTSTRNGLGRFVRNFLLPW